MLLWGMVSPIRAQQDPDALEIIANASEACKALQYVEYNTVSEQGALVVEAHVIQQKADVKDVGLGPGRLLVSGEMNIGQKSQEFQFSYDGEALKLHEIGKGALKILENPEPRTVGRLLGLFYYNLANAYYVNPGGMDFLTGNEADIAYVEKVDLDGKEAHHLKISRTITNPATKEARYFSTSWYFDSKSFLPVRRVSGSITTSVDYLSLQPSKEKVVFDINPNLDFEETLVSGNEPYTEGLLSPGTPFPDFELPGKTGEMIPFEEVRKTVTIIDFWGTWCGPCLMAMPKLQALFDKYGDKGLNLVGISVADKPGKAEKFVDKKGYTYQFLFQGDDLARQMKLNTYPTLYIVDAEGKVLHAEKGNRQGADKTYEQIIKRALKIDE